MTLSDSGMASCRHWTMKTNDRAEAHCDYASTIGSDDMKEV